MKLRGKSRDAEQGSTWDSQLWFDCKFSPNSQFWSVWHSVCPHCTLHLDTPGLHFIDFIFQMKIRRGNECWSSAMQCTTYTTTGHIRLTWASLRKYRFSMFHGFSNTVNHSLKTFLCLMEKLPNGKLKMFCCADIFWAGSLLRGNIIGSWSRIWNVTSGWSNIFLTLLETDLLSFQM